ncbi:MAG: FKBP-type peptidyl-prolyl cis-trans isomerase [Verrucomicrobiaceae bacterium]
MKLNLLLLTVTLAFAAIASAQETKPNVNAATATKPAAPIDPAALKDKVSYFYGADVARSFRDNGVDISMDSFLQGLKDTVEKKPSKYTPEELDAAMNQFAQTMVAKQQKDMAEAGLKNGAEGEKFLADNAKRDGVTTTASGLQYEIIRKGDGAKPAASDTVTVHYHGTLVNGKVFDSSVDRKEPATFPVGGVIPGWVEALQLMPLGSKWKLFIPSKLAYGDRGAGPEIGPGSALIFEVELLKIEPKQ